jgi:hypothetical protein
MIIIIKMITEHSLNEFNKKLHYKKNEYPQCSCGACFKLFFNGLFVAARNSGKTYAMSRIIKHYETNKIEDKDGNVFKVRTIIISPTVEQNTVFQSLKSLNPDDIYDKYSESLIEEIVQDVDAKTALFKEYQEYQQIYKKFMNLKADEINKLDDYELSLLVKNNWENNMEKPDAFITFIVLDDLLGANAFTQSKRSKLMNFYIKNRHHGIIFLIAVQSLKSVPREIRLNTNLFFLGKFASSKIILEDCYEEVSNTITIEDFTNLYNYSILDKYGALVIDLTNEPPRFLKSLDSELFI